ncbi:MAG: hypothetical protein JXQ71_00020 [Verrucomicrobia bacterium]|nr:hypothetical protein [Verrucomicrobiota bacterium]
MNTKPFLLPLLAGLVLAGCNKSPQPEAAPPPEAPSAAASEPDAAPEPPLLLQLKWPVGARYVQHMDIVQQVQTTISGLTQTNRQDYAMSHDFGLTVLGERLGGGREVELEFLAMQMTASDGRRVVVSLDSRSDAAAGTNNPLAEVLRSMVGTRMKFSLDASNRVVRLVGLQDFRHRVLTNSPALARASLAQMLSEDYFKLMIHGSQGLPPHPVRPGDSWPVTTEIAMGPLGVMEVKLQYMLKGFESRDERRCALLEFSGIVKGRPGREAAMPNFRMSVQEGTTAGQSWFDPEAGMILASEISQDMTMNLELHGSQPGATNERVAPRSMTTRITQQIHLAIRPQAAPDSP